MTRASEIADVRQASSHRGPGSRRIRRACLALATTSGRVALTADRAWGGVAEATGIAVESIALPDA